MLKKDYVRDGNRRIIGSVTTGFDDTTAVVRGERNQITGRTNERFDTTRDSKGSLISINFHGALRARSERLFMPSGISRDSPVSHCASLTFRRAFDSDSTKTELDFPQYPRRN